MGIDLLDITFRLEKNLGTALPHREFWLHGIENIEIAPGRFTKDLRVKRMHELLCVWLGLRKSVGFDLEECRHAVMESLQAACNVAPALLAPEVKFDEVLPWKNRYTHWRRFEERMGRPIPPRQVSSVTLAVGTGIGVITLGCLMFGAMSVLNAQDSSEGFRVLGVAAGLFGVLVVTTICSKPSTFPSHCQTIEDLAQWLARIQAVGASRQDRDVDSAKDPENPISVRDEAEVWRVLQEVLVAVLAVTPDQVVSEALLVRDLGCQ